MEKSEEGWFVLELKKGLGTASEEEMKEYGKLLLNKQNKIAKEKHSFQTISPEEKLEILKIAKTQVHYPGINLENAASSVDKYGRVTGGAKDD